MSRPNIVPSERRQLIVALLAGLLFALGLGVAGMTDPAKVLAFLNIAAAVDGGWDPSLALVMGGAIAVYMPIYRWVTARERPQFAERLHLPGKTQIDAKLVAGAALFGLGWGLAGLCPGPAVVAATTGAVPLVVFALAMVFGMLAHRWVGRALEARRAGAG